MQWTFVLLLFKEQNRKKARLVWIKRRIKKNMKNKSFKIYNKQEYYQPEHETYDRKEY